MYYNNYRKSEYFDISEIFLKKQNSKSIFLSNSIMPDQHQIYIILLASYYYNLL